MLLTALQGLQSFRMRNDHNISVRSDEDRIVTDVVLKPTGDQVQHHILPAGRVCQLSTGSALLSFSSAHPCAAGSRPVCSVQPPSHHCWRLGLHSQHDI
jgi:hypothetical protein